RPPHASTPGPRIARRRGPSKASPSPLSLWERARVRAAMPKRRARKDAAAVTRYAPASRLHELRPLLDSHEGVSIYDIAERFDVNPRTAPRYIPALQHT